MSDTGPRTKIGTAADRQRIENVGKLTARIGDGATYHTRGIAGHWCLLADALNPAYSPSPMAFSKQKQQVLRGLEAGRKLHELMREPGMPSKSMLDEWRSNDPEFDAAYQQAEEQGRAHRQEQPKPKAAPVVVDEAGREHAIPRSSALQRERAVPSLADAILRAPQPPAEQPAAPTLVAARSKEEELKAEMLRRRQAGEKASDLMATTRGFDGVKLSAWRKADPVFKAAWDACRQQGGATAARDPEPAPQGAALAGELQAHVTRLETGLQQARQEVERLTEAGQATLARCQQLDEDNNRLLAEVAEQAKFKAYVHERLDAAGINPHHEQNALNGCRIGKRLDDLILYKDVTHAFGHDEPAPATPEPVAPPHPGYLLAELLRQAGTSRRQLAAALGIKADRLKDILGGRAHLTLPLCAALERLCIGTAEIWARRQVDYLTHQKPQTAAE